MFADWSCTVFVNNIEHAVENIAYHRFYFLIDLCNSFISDLHLIIDKLNKYTQNKRVNIQGCKQDLSRGPAQPHIFYFSRGRLAYIATPRIQSF